LKGKKRLKRMSNAPSWGDFPTGEFGEYEEFEEYEIGGGSSSSDWLSSGNIPPMSSFSPSFSQTRSSSLSRSLITSPQKVSTDKDKGNATVNTSVEMTSFENMAEYHPVVGEIKNVSIGEGGSGSIYRLKITSKINDFFTAQNQIGKENQMQFEEESPNSFPISRFYSLLSKNISSCFGTGTSKFEPFLVYNSEDIARLGLEFYIYYVPSFDHTSNANAFIMDISVFSLFVVSTKLYKCEIWNICKNSGSNSGGRGVTQPFLSLAISDAAHSLYAQFFWIGIELASAPASATDLFQLFHFELGFHEPMITNKTLFGVGFSTPTIELILTPGSGNSSDSYIDTPSVFTYFMHLYYNTGQVRFAQFSFTEYMVLPESVNINISIAKSLLPSETTDPGTLRKTTKALTSRSAKNVELYGTKSNKNRISLAQLHKLLVYDTPSEVAGVFNGTVLSGGSKDGRVQYALDKIHSVTSTTERSAVSDANFKPGNFTFHSHPAGTIQGHGCSLGWPSTPDFDSVMFGFGDINITHFVFSSEGLYMIQNGFMFNNYQTELGIHAGQLYTQEFFQNIRALVQIVSAFLETRRCSKLVLPRGLVSYTRNDWTHFMNSLTLLDFFPDQSNPRNSESMKETVLDMVDSIVNDQTISGVFQDASTRLPLLIKWFYKFLEFGVTTTGHPSLFRKMFKTPLYNIDFIPTAFINTSETNSVLYHPTPNV